MPRQKKLIPKQLTDRDDIQIFILYLFDKIGYPMTKDDIHNVGVLDGFVTSFDFIECFDSLLKEGKISEIDENGVSMYFPTPEGLLISDNLNGKLPFYFKDTALKSALKYLDFEKRGIAVSSSATEKPHGKYEFECSIREKEDTLLEVRITLDSYKQLEKVKHAFSADPEHIYRGILSLLSGDAEYLLK